MEESIVVSAPAQYSQPSRKSKRAWRKNVDITEMEEGLERVRDDMITSGVVVSEIPAAELFTTDAVGQPEIRDRAAKKRKLLRADEILAQRSAVPGLEGRKKAIPGYEKLSNGIVEKAKKTSVVSGREYERLRKIAYGGQTVQKDVVKESEYSAGFDPWAGDGVAEEVKRLATSANRRDFQKEVEEVLGKEKSFLEKKKDLQEPDTLKRPRVSLSANGKPIKAVRKPAGEKSYNPELEAWQNRLERLGAREVEIERKRLDALALQEEIEKKRQQTRLEEEEEAARGYGGESDWESEWEGLQSETEGLPESALKKRPERKTPQERKKADRKKLEAGRKKHEEKRKEKEKRMQIEMIKKLSREVQAVEKLREEKKLQIATLDDGESSDDGDDVELRKIQPFGKAKIPAARLEVMLPEELPDSLRRLRPEGNALHDRYRSLLLQGKIESRKHAQNKKPEKKTTEKWSYKDWKLQ